MDRRRASALSSDREDGVSIVVPRFDMDATDRDGARLYLRERAHQALVDGFRPASDDVEPLSSGDVEWGARAVACDRQGKRFQTVYVYAPHRARGHLSRYLASTDLPIVTIPDCDIEAYLAKKGTPFVVIGRFTEWTEYRAIQATYGTRAAERSGVLYMHHVDEGLAVLERIGATERARRAFCLHPLVQNDVDLARTYADVGSITDDPQVLTLALEYRNIANATLAHREIASAADIPLSPLPEVSQMLIADKVQNRKDFVLHHLGTHPRTALLDRYFHRWLERLGVSEEAFAAHFEALQVAAAPLSLERALAERRPTTRAHG